MADAGETWTPMGAPRVGDCSVCKERQRVRLSRLGLTVFEWHTRPDAHGPNSTCAGSHLPSADDPRLTKQRAQRAVARRRKFMDLVKPFQIEAAVAMDALLEGKPYPAADLKILARVAVYYYKQHHHTPWDADVLHYVPRKSRQGVSTYSGDLYCLFCGELRTRNVKVSRHASRTEIVHAASLRDGRALACAFKHLAFGLVPVAPDVRKLPDEYAADTKHAEGGS